jgi:hypothetical protein
MAAELGQAVVIESRMGLMFASIASFASGPIAHRPNREFPADWARIPGHDAPGDGSKFVVVPGQWKCVNDLTLRPRPFSLPHSAGKGAISAHPFVALLARR